MEKSLKQLVQSGRAESLPGAQSPSRCLEEEQELPSQPIPTSPKEDEGKEKLLYVTDICWATSFKDVRLGRRASQEGRQSLFFFH